MAFQYGKGMSDAITGLNPFTDMIDDQISKCNVVILDFSGMDVMTTAFLNASIGQL